MTNWTSADINPKEKRQYNVHCDSDQGRFVTALHWDGKNWCWDYEGTCGEPLFSSAWYIEVLDWTALPELPEKKR